MPRLARSGLQSGNGGVVTERITAPPTKQNGTSGRGTRLRIDSAASRVPIFQTKVSHHEQEEDMRRLLSL
jgi:hypothetical protein